MAGPQGVQESSPDYSAPSSSRGPVDVPKAPGRITRPGADSSVVVVQTSIPPGAMVLPKAPGSVIRPNNSGSSQVIGNELRFEPHLLSLRPFPLYPPLQLLQGIWIELFIGASQTFKVGSPRIQSNTFPESAYATTDQEKSRCTNSQDRTAIERALRRRSVEQNGFLAYKGKEAMRSRPHPPMRLVMRIQKRRRRIHRLRLHLTINHRQMFGVK